MVKKDKHRRADGIAEACGETTAAGEHVDAKHGQADNYPEVPVVHLHSLSLA
jgi:hypothetical protein